MVFKNWDIRIISWKFVTPSRNRRASTIDHSFRTSIWIKIRFQIPTVCSFGRVEIQASSLGLTGLPCISFSPTTLTTLTWTGSKIPILVEECTALTRVCCRCWGRYLDSFTMKIRVNFFSIWITLPMCYSYNSSCNTLCLCADVWDIWVQYRPNWSRTVAYSLNYWTSNWSQVKQNGRIVRQCFFLAVHSASASYNGFLGAWAVKYIDSYTVGEAWRLFQRYRNEYNVQSIEMEWRAQIRIADNKIKSGDW